MKEDRQGSTRNEEGVVGDGIKEVGLTWEREEGGNLQQQGVCMQH